MIVKDIREAELAFFECKKGIEVQNPYVSVGCKREDIAIKELQIMGKTNSEDIGIFVLLNNAKVTLGNGDYLVISHLIEGEPQYSYSVLLTPEILEKILSDLKFFYFAKYRRYP